MELSEQLLLRRLENVDVFYEAREGDFAPTSRATELFGELKTVITALQGAQNQQGTSGGGSLGATRAKTAILGELWRDMGRIEKTAPQMRTLSDQQKAILVRPAKRELEIVSRAKVFIDLCTPIWSQFQAYELPATLPAEMQSDLDDYNAAYSSQQGGRQARIGAGISIETELAQGEAILDELRPIVNNKFDGNDAVLREWASATRYPERDKTKPKPPPAS